ncbi:F0F1 ATP synthase subunit delta, partial [Streptomyces zhihengii]
GRLDNVEDELFRFGRILATSPELRSALTDRAATAAAKGELLGSLLGGKAEKVTERLIVGLVTHPRGRSLEAGLDSLSKLAAERRDRMVAVVTSAVPLTEAQKQRLGAGLARIYGREMHLNLEVDPEVLGGISVRVGDELINGTVQERIDEAKRRIAG